MNRNIIHIDELTSTNSFLRDLAAKGDVEEGTVITTDFQTNGRGQKSASWESDPCKNLLFSFIIYPSFIKANRQFILSQICSLAIKKTLDRYTDNISIKWPNDIYRNDKKICGMLLENDLTDDVIKQTICGIGVNINQTEFKSDAPNPVSLKQITNIAYDKEKILKEILTEFSDLYTRIENSENTVWEEYKAALYRNSGFHLYRDNSGDFRAVIKDITPDGQLILLTPEGKQKRYRFKEVSFI